jgi:hypothetical protein
LTFRFIGESKDERNGAIIVSGAGLALYVFDFVSDCFVCLQHRVNGDFWWFFITLIFIVVPSVIVNFRATSQLKKLGTCNKMKYVAIFANCGVIFRYIQELKQWKKGNFDKTPCKKSNQCCSCEVCLVWYTSQKEKSLKSAHSLAKLCYLETITESAPQWCLQTYIMLRQWYFPWYTVASIVLSLLSLALSITMLEKARETKENRNFRSITTVSFLIWQLASLISRLSAIVILAYVHRYYVIIFLAINWLLLAVVVSVVDGGNIYSQPDNPGLLFFGVWALCYPVMFHSSESQIAAFEFKNHKRHMAVGNVLLALGNIIMLTLSVTVANPYAPYMELLKPVAISLVVGGLLISSIFFLAYYKCCLPETNYNDQMDNVFSVVNKAFEEEA